MHQHTARPGSEFTLFDDFLRNPPLLSIPEILLIPEDQLEARLRRAWQERFAVRVIPAAARAWLMRRFTCVL